MDVGRGPAAGLRQRGRGHCGRGHCSTAAGGPAGPAGGGAVGTAERPFVSARRRGALLSSRPRAGKGFRAGGGTSGNERLLPGVAASIVGSRRGRRSCPAGGIPGGSSDGAGLRDGEETQLCTLAGSVHSADPEGGQKSPTKPNRTAAWAEARRWRDAAQQVSASPERAPGCCLWSWDVRPAASFLPDGSRPASAWGRARLGAALPRGCFQPKGAGG